MTENPPSFESFRSPALMNVADTALVIIDVQQKLVPLIENHEQMVWNIGRLIEGARVLGVKIVATEQYPKGLGGTVEALRSQLGKAGVNHYPDKTMFSCRQCEPTFAELAESGITKLLLSGIETHVCVTQSALDLIALGFDVYVCVDAIGSRHPIDHVTALRRMENEGVTATTTEAALFEWCERAGSDQFKQISKLVQTERGA